MSVVGHLPCCHFTDRRLCLLRSYSRCADGQWSPLLVGLTCILNNVLTVHIIFGWDVMSHLGPSLLELFPTWLYQFITGVLIIIIHVWVLGP